METNKVAPGGFAQDRLDCPEPGLYQCVPMDEYLAWDAMSNSKLSHLKRSPAHYFFESQNPGAPTDAMDFGTMVHACVLEPEVFEARYRPHRPGSRATKEVKASMADIEAEGFFAVRPEEYEACQHIRANILAHPAASYLLDQTQSVETGFVWSQTVEEMRVVRCKARADMLAPSSALIVDLKTARDGSPGGFARSIATYGYARAAAHYLAGMRALGLDYSRFAFIVAEKTPPYLVAVYNLDEQSIAMGSEEQYRLLSLYARCRERNEWPGYSESAETLALPSWAANEIAEDALSAADLSGL